MIEVQAVQLSRARGWRKPPNCIVVSRPGKWGNPFVIGKPSIYGDVPDAPTAVRFYEQWLSSTEEGRRVAASAANELRGKSLACWCRLDAHCHRTTLLRIANAAVA